ncbi:helix-turn-helix transcriptional regulator [Pseudomonas fluorescens]|uniref:ArsR/SmtB family transcription factor n=1 Tax=Pseudomonas fluorescens group TaxID=136843 RepID=UPI00177E6562|nr:helix-turn-helix transcriptional regulator [Pseudomonas fluorescens]MBD8151285.1 helix-turn-helix transcriptional regulator [Pseudomonas fluorescens]MBD8179902.1 helix-turn-helix transcriptional regulator [Pseudomonas fluorescens]MBD8748415.1 helix-turn-helix transcriptional regulator [Pseudomonas fluorescens]MBD8753265.1 helix-turn-helix transcriptional regulator [Pseudomonas fluorescens]MBD8762682.1 helix-turn-helix transcriptional regulator [Pseudomonas fluorescens]
MDSQRNETAISRVAGAIAEPARTKMLCSLMDGHARTSTEMAVIADVSASTASAHLARLKEDGLIKLHTQGRHRYFSLAEAHVAQAIEALMVISRNAQTAFVSTTPTRLQLARTCYDHMAGSLAVQLHDCFIDLGWLTLADAGDGMYQLTVKGEKGMTGLGVEIETVRAQRRRFACSCLDWSMRRPHLAGALGAAVLQAVRSRKWVIQDLDSRALALTPKGRKELYGRFGIKVEDKVLDKSGTAPL